MKKLFEKLKTLQLSGSDLPSAVSLTVMTWRWYLQNFWKLMKVSAWWLLSLPFILPSSLMSVAGLTSSGEIISRTPENVKVFIFFVALGTIMSILVSIFVRPALVMTIHERIYKRKISPIKAFKHSKTLLLSYAVVMIIVGISISLGFLAFFIPGVIIAMYLLFAEQAVVLEGKKGLGALKRSYQLVKGRFWAVLWRFMFANAIFYIGLTLVSTLLINAPLALLREAALTGPITLRIIVAPFVILGAVLSVITIPLFLSLQVILYEAVTNLTEKKN